MKVLLFANTDWYLFNFRLPLALALRDSGAEVVLVSPDGAYGRRLVALNFRWIPIPMERQSLNPLRELVLLWHLACLYRHEMPDVVHHFTVKCVIYGSLAAYVAGIKKRINAVAGLGYVFSANDALANLLRPFVRALLKLALAGRDSRLILQNSDDRISLQRTNLVSANRVRLIRGSGVNTERFRPREAAAYSSREFRVILAARLLRDKGVEEYVEAAKLLKSTGLPIECFLAGSPDPGNPASVPADRVQAWSDSRAVTVLGHVHDMVFWLHQVDAAVLPTYYREGVPRGLIEAAACGLPIVTTNEPGCREIVEHGHNGLVVPVRDAKAIADAILFLYEHPIERVRMGIAGREKVLREFDEKIVLSKTLDVYRELIPELPPKANAGAAN